MIRWLGFYIVVINFMICDRLVAINKSRQLKEEFIWISEIVKCNGIEVVLNLVIPTIIRFCI